MRAYIVNKLMTTQYSVFFEELTLDEIGCLLDISGERVRQVENQTLRHLKVPSNRKMMQSVKDTLDHFKIREEI